MCDEDRQTRSRSKAIEAVQVYATEHAARLAKLKKSDLDSEAERLAVGTGRLPAMLQAAVPKAPAETLLNAEVSE